MSRWDVLQAARVAGALLPLPLRMPSDETSRTMFITPEIRGLLEGPWASETWEKRCGSLHATLETFTQGRRISVSLVPYEHGEAFMGRLDKPTDEVWDIRCRQERPGLRVFGRFLAKDTFVAIACSPRSVDIHELKKKPLGDLKKSMEWELAIIDCMQVWEKILPGVEPIHGDEIQHYISANVISA